MVSILFSHIKTLEFKTTRHHDVFPRVLMTKVSIGWVKGLVPNRRQAITWTRANQDTWGHCNLMAPYGVRDFGQHWFKYWYDTMLAPGHYLNQSYLTVNRTLINSLTPEQNGRHFAGGISNAFFFVNRNLCTSTNILSKYILDGIIGKKSALDELIARCITGDKSNLLFIEPS